MGKAVEPCIHRVDATKTKPAGYRVRKWVHDLNGERRHISKIFRPLDDSEEERQLALQRARDFVRHLEVQKRSGEIHRRLEPKKAKRPGLRGYGLPWHEYPEEMHAEINREFDEEHLRKKREDKLKAEKGRHKFSEFMEGHLDWYRENTGKSNFQKKRAAWNAVKTFCEKTGSDLTSKKIGEIRPSEIDQFVSWLASRKKKAGEAYYSKSSVKGYFALVRSFFKNWAAEEGKRNPAAPELLKTDVQRLRGREETEKVPDSGQLEKLEQGIEKAISDSGKRYLHLRVILRYIHRVLMGTGMRISETLYLSEDHIDVDEMTITIEGAVVDGEPGLTKTGKRKGSKAAGTRIIPISEAVLEAVGDWMQIRTKYGYPDVEDCSTIFCRRDGSYYTDDQIRSYYKRACSKVEMDGSVTPHQIRHLYNDRLRKAGGSPEVRQAILGHADAETNEGYTAVKALEGREVVEKIATLP